MIVATRYHIEKEADSTGRVCRKCGARVWESYSNKYEYHCFECNSNLSERETMLASEQTPKVEGVKDGETIQTEEYCPFCEKVTSNVPENRMSLCAHCEAEMFPCASCKQENGCQWNYEDHGCQRFIHTPAWVEKMNQKENQRG